MKRVLFLFLLACAGISSATVHTVNVNALTFSPANLTVQQGDTVRWVKTGGFHNVSESSNPPVFRSGDPTGSPFTYNFAFNAPLSGTYDYVCEVHEGSGMVGTVTVEAGGNPPDAPTYLSPMNGATAQPIAGTLSWNVAQGAEHYVVRLGTTNPPPIVNNNFGNTSFSYAGLNLGTQYFWQVTSVNDFGSADGNIWSFTTFALPPQAENPSPPNGAANVPVTNSLEWNLLPNTSSYEVFLGTTEPLPSIGTVTQNSITPPTVLETQTTYLWRVNTINDAGTTTGVTWSFTTEVGSDADDHTLPASFKIDAAYPNPFNNNVQISFSLAQASVLSARIFDISGREVGTLVNGRLSAGEHRLEWNADGQAAGLYFLQVRGANALHTQKLIYLP